MWNLWNSPNTCFINLIRNDHEWRSSVCGANTEKKWATSWENLFLPYVNNKGADQPAHPRSLISAFVICCSDCINICSFYMQNLKPLANLCSWVDRFESYLVANPEDRFSRDEAQIYRAFSPFSGSSPMLSHGKKNLQRKAFRPS